MVQGKDSEAEAGTRERTTEGLGEEERGLEKASGGISGTQG